MTKKCKVILRVPGAWEKSVEVDCGKSVGDVLREQGLLPNEYIASMDGRVVTEDVRIERDTVLTLYPVVSGG